MGEDVSVGDSRRAYHDGSELREGVIQISVRDGNPRCRSPCIGGDVEG
jgi:hypothetical protein